jgi:hypothetical protein
MTRSAKTTVVTAAFVMNVVHEQYRPFCFGLSPRKALVVSLFATTALSLVFLATGERTARAAQTIATISSAPAPAAPRLGNTTVFASKPGSPLLFTVGATGQSPLSFSATGLPSGLALSQTGTLTGTTPADGSYPIVVTVTNPAGKAQGTVTLLAQDTLAATPVMGWNSYDSFGSTVTETEVMQAAQAEQSILLPAGYRYVVVDYLWFDPEDTIDAYGRFLPSTSRFPSATGPSGFTSLAARVHALGLAFGIHIMRGIPRVAVKANTPIWNSTYTAADAGNTSDACPWDNHMWGVYGAKPAGQAWYDSILAQYTDWGIDFIKVDDMLNPDVDPLVYHQDEVDAVRQSIEKTGRSIVLSVSPGPMQTANAADLEANANQWRMVDDFWDKDGLSTLPDVFTASVSWQGVAGLSPGHWPDADMLPLGYLGPRCPVHASGPTAFSKNQQVTVMSLWGILPSPLIFGGNVPMLASDPWTTALLTNEEVIAVNQDSAGKEAALLSQSATQQIWSRDLSSGRKAVGFFNSGTQDATMAVTFAALGISPQSTVRDTWHRTGLTVTGAGPSVDVPYESAALLVITPPQTAGTDAGTGDVPEDAMADGSSGGRDGSATSSSSSSSSGSSGSPGGSGSSTASDSSGSATSSSSSGSSGNLAGNDAGSASSTGTSSACGCVAAGAPSNGFGAVGFVAATAFAARRRRSIFVRVCARLPLR